MSFPRYTNYKASGVEWLGDVPSHWAATKLKHVGQAQIGLTYDPTEIVDESEGTLVLRSSNVQQGNIVFDDNVFVKTIIPPRLRTQLGDILICSRNGSRALIGKNAMIGPDAAGLTFGAFMTVFRSGLNRFLYWMFNSQIFELQSASFLTSTINQLTIGNLNGFEVLLPPPDEQIAISTFLARETSKIDELVAEQRRLIELLTEKRQAIISRAVTKGLNPHAHMKASGVEWLGEVPAHWDVLRIANVFNEVNDPGNDQLPVLSVSIHDGVSDKELDDDELDRKVTRSDDRTKYKRVTKNDLVYNMMRAWQGGFGTVTVDGMVSPAYVVARPRTALSTAYIEHVLRTPQAIEQMRRFSRGVTDFRLRLYWDEFKNLTVPLPPRSEAIAICKHIEAMIESFDAICGVSEESIDLLQERRTALISAAVTGKIDVREIVK